MLEIIISALLALGIITSSDQATETHYQTHKTQVDTYIIDTEVDVY